MNQLLYEGRTLVGMVSSIIRQDALHILYSRLDWERMFRIADYHKVANIVYLSILGKGDALPDRWKDRFFERYQEALLFGENCDESLKELLMWLEMQEVSCIVLTSGSVRSFYQIPETAENTPISILLSEEEYFFAKGYLIDLGYETDQVYKGYGERMKKVSGVSVILYRKLPFRTALYQKNMIKLLEFARLGESYKYIRVLSIENEFVYRMARAAYRYVTDELTLREVLDLLLCHQTWREQLNMEAVWKKLKDFQIEELSEKILRIAYMWFGNKKDMYFERQLDDMAAYDVLEERLLTKGIINRESDEQALQLQKKIEKELLKEKRREERKRLGEKIRNYQRNVKRKIRWVFPDYHYMSSLYPSLEKIPVLLPFFWLIRGARVLWNAILG